ncbi:tRNA(Met) cytidine acetyltransferase TmcA [Paraglaciecola mesophila]|uniref:tRNA(Met) cytidine acetyltransferase TmcA n=1 Tax=Paraglaciecola mesophila TaxID=197222 RepID=A0A857JIK5_9ALTE|nr:GNAT family N-acetyltransferase [Paraglaciecola mesophila]QHJ11132.1 tRNA(Met) cytidine acetyltransferase TmcA [Paraglaciecola mesophila]
MDLHFKIEEWAKQRKSAIFHRQLAVISGPKEWAENQAQSLASMITLSDKETLWVGDKPDKEPPVSPKAYRQYLGTEYATVIFNCFSGISANALMAFSGTIQANGLMIILCPEFNRWPLFTDPLSNSRYSYGFTQVLEPSRFIKRLISMIEEDDDTVIITPTSFSGCNKEVSTAEINRKLNSTTPEQEHLISSILRFRTGHRKRPLVITADRGRGKSSALGLAARTLISKHASHIIITAPNKRNVEQVFAFANIEQNANNQHPLVFVAPDALIEDDYQADLLFIDEAAAIPSSILKALLNKYSRVVLSSTVHGYEGAGRGFELRFKPYLENEYKGWKNLMLKTPIRWYKDDCLEHFWFRVFIMEDSTSGACSDPLIECSNLTPEMSGNKSLAKHSVDYAFIEATKDLLASAPHILKQVFSLLINAHYQTSPDDLLRLLDAFEQRIFACTLGDEVIGVALICSEGGSALSEVSQGIINGSRRVNGHLVAQNLALHCADDAFVKIEQWRIVRIAVSNAYRRKHLASALLTYIEASAKELGITLLTSSFGATPTLLNFWTHNQYLPLKLGFKRDASSDEVSLIVGKPLTDLTATLLKTAQIQFSEELVYHAARYHQSMDTRLLTHLLTHCQPKELGSHTNQRVQQYLISNTPYMSFSQALATYVLHKLTCIECPSQIPQESYILVASLIQFKTTKALVNEFKLSGKKELSTNIKNAVAKM